VVSEGQEAKESGRRIPAGIVQILNEVVNLFGFAVAKFLLVSPNEELRGRWQREQLTAKEGGVSRPTPFGIVPRELTRQV
jgi:hypothetical protein